AVSNAICTSGEPVSVGSRRNWSMISVFRSFVIAIAVLTTSAWNYSCQDCLASKPGYCHMNVAGNGEMARAVLGREKSPPARPGPGEGRPPPRCHNGPGPRKGRRLGAATIDPVCGFQTGYPLKVAEVARHQGRMVRQHDTCYQEIGPPDLLQTAYLTKS